LKSEPNDPVWVQKAKRNEERNEAMNLNNSAQKANSKAYNKGYDDIKWGMTTPETMEWYGYVHVDGGLHIRRYFTEQQAGDIDEAIESDFVAKVIGPFMAPNRAAALKFLRKAVA